MPPRHPRLDSAFALVRAGRVAEGEPDALFTLGEIHWCGRPRLPVTNGIKFLASRWIHESR